MKITAQEEYGLRCLLRLARAEDGQSLTIPEIAAAEGLSVPYVAKLLSVLRQAGLIESVRGRAGGYRLARPPAEIGLGSVLLVAGRAAVRRAGLLPAARRDRRPTATASTTAAAPCAPSGTRWNTGCGTPSTRSPWPTCCRASSRIAELLRSRLADAVFEPPSDLVTLTSLSQGLIRYFQRLAPESGEPAEGCV